MNDESIPNDSAEQSNDQISASATTESSTTQATPNTVVHRYYEVGTDVLSKPNALCDILEAQNQPLTAVFCNTPSDADLVEVILKKRGVSTLKLIGHVPPMRAARALKQAKSGEVSCLVITDVSGQSLDVEELDMVVNYSLPSDPEIYIHRCGHSRPAARLSQVISLIAALDIANLHYLRKIVEFSIDKAELPSKEQLMAAKLDSIKRQALEIASANDQKLLELVNAVLADDKKVEIIAHLLRNTIDLIPSLQAAIAPRAEREEGFDREDERRESRGGDRYGERGQDRQPGNRGDRRGDRRGRGRDRDRDRGPREDRHTDDYFDEPLSEAERQAREAAARLRQGRGDIDDRGEREERGGRGDRRDRDRGERGERSRRDRSEREFVPAERNARIYLGQGSEQGISKDKLTELISSRCSLAPDTVKTVSIRRNYSFVDLPEPEAEVLVSTFSEGDLVDFAARRAITVTVPRPQQPREQDELSAGENSGADVAQEGASGEL